MNKEELLKFYDCNKDKCVTVNAWSCKARIDLKDLFELFKLLQEKEE